MALQLSEHNLIASVVEMTAIPLLPSVTKPEGQEQADHRSGDKNVADHCREGTAMHPVHPLDRVRSLVLLKGYRHFVHGGHPSCTDRPPCEEHDQA